MLTGLPNYPSALLTGSLGPVPKGGALKIQSLRARTLPAQSIFHYAAGVPSRFRTSLLLFPPRRGALPPHVISRPC